MTECSESENIVIITHNIRIYHNNPSAFESENNDIIIVNIKISDIYKCSFCKSTMHINSKSLMDKKQKNRRWITNFVVDIGDDDGQDLVVGEFDGGNRSHVRGRVGLRSLWKPQIAAASLRVTRQQPLVNSH